MIYRSFLAAILCMTASLSLPAQISRDAKFEILRTVIAEQAAARIALPFGNDGVDIEDSGQVNKDKLSADIKKNGQSIETGKVVTVTEISFDDNKIQIELDGGGKNKKGFWIVSKLVLEAKPLQSPGTTSGRPRVPRLFFALQRKFLRISHRTN